MAIEAKHYQETRDRLQADPVVIEMAATLPAEHVHLVTHDGTAPTFSFMQGANAEYKKRGGADAGHIGAVAEAIIALVKARK